MSETLKAQPFMTHLLELRDRLMRSVLVVLVLLLMLFPFGNDIYTFIADPLMAVLPEGASMIATRVASPFLTPFKLALVAAIFLAMPFLLYQLWSFIAPGLYRHEKRLALPMLASSIFLFYLGAAFAYVVVFPLVFAFLTSTAPEGVLVMTDITEYLDFVLTLFFAFGISFQVPVATVLLVLAKISTPKQLSSKRPYVIVGAFIMGMLLTPPDVISQTLLAVPVWLLFEIGVFLARLVVRQRDARAEELEAETVSGVSQTGVSQAEAETSEPAASQETNADTSAETVHPFQDAIDEGRYRPMTEEEMDAELDLIEEQERSEDTPAGDSSGDSDTESPVSEATAETSYVAPAGESGSGRDTDADGSVPEANEAPPHEVPTDFVPDAVDNKLERIMTLREEGRFEEARTRLYEVLVEGNETQVRVARNILSQMDD